METLNNLNKLDTLIKSKKRKEPKKILICSSNDFSYTAKKNKKGSSKSDFGLTIALYDNNTVEF